MSSSFNNALRRAERVPGWMVLVVALVAVAVTAVVAGHRHTAAEGPTNGAADSGPLTDLNVSSSPAAQTREAPISRGAVRRGHAGAARHAVRVIEATAPLKRKPAPPPVPLAPSNAAQTVASAEASTSNLPGLCLTWSREQADIPSLYSDATSAWEHATGRHPGDLEPPAGAATYWTGGSSGYGHVAISVGHGKVRSSDAGGLGSVATVPLRSITREWHLTYAGWANSINGYTIPGVAGA